MQHWLILLNKAASRDPIVVTFVRRLVLTCLRVNILFRAQYVFEVKNGLAD